MAQRVGVGPGQTGFYLVFQYMLFACLGLCCSYLWNTNFTKNVDSSYLHQFSSASTEEHSLEYVQSILKGIDCDMLKKTVRVPSEMKNYLGTKLRYQFEEVVKDASSIGPDGRCIAVKLYGLIRHGTRYPTTKHLMKWESLREKLPERLPPAGASKAPVGDPDFTEFLHTWSNQLYQDVNNGKVNATDLTVGGIREEYCLGCRVRQHLPNLFKLPYSLSSYELRSTELQRTVLSALAFSVGVFGGTHLKNVYLKILEKEKDILLRYYDLPCPDYENKVVHNTSFTTWLKSFLSTPVFNSVVENIQRHFDPDYWKLDAADVAMFYQICIHELSVLGKSRWCDLFSPEQLSVLQFNGDLKAYWVKSSAYAITGKRSVYLLKSILDFFVKGKQSVALSFAHAETFLPFLAFLGTFPVNVDLTPSNYHEQRTREFMTSVIVPYSGNAQLILYECQEDGDELSESDVQNKQFVRLLVNERPVRMDLCGSVPENWADSLSLCPLEQLVKNAYNATGGFAGLTQLCHSSN